MLSLRGSRVLPRLDEYSTDGRRLQPSHVIGRELSHEAQYYTPVYTGIQLTLSSVISQCFMRAIRAPALPNHERQTICCVTLP